MTQRPVRLATRAIILRDNRLLMVNAWADKRLGLLCAPGGGAEPHQSLPENLAREVYEETGLTVAVGAPCLVNEFHDPEGSFHQVDIYFRCKILSGDPDGDWTDPEGVVTQRLWLTREQLMTHRFKPDSLPAVVWRDPGAPTYDPLEPLQR